MVGKIKVIKEDGTVRDFSPSDMGYDGAVERGSENRGETKRIIKEEFAKREKIERFVVAKVRRFFYGPTLTPSIRNQALHFSSFGTYVHLDRMKRREEHVRTRD